MGTMKRLKSKLKQLTNKKAHNYLKNQIIMRFGGEYRSIEVPLIVASPFLSTKYLRAVSMGISLSLCEKYLAIILAYGILWSFFKVSNQMAVVNHAIVE